MYSASVNVAQKVLQANTKVTERVLGGELDTHSEL
jgi:hypothetical protein